MVDILSGSFLANVAGTVAIISIALAVAFIFFPNLIQKRIPLKKPYNILFILASAIFLAILLLANIHVLVLGNTWYEKIWFLLQYSHFFSASTFVVIMGLMWWKRGFILALVLSLASFSIIEFICIPQHMILFGWILPYMFNWYVPFLCDVTPFLVLLLSGKLRFSKKFYIFMLAGFLSLAVASYLVGYARIYWNWDIKAFTAKDPLPETGFGFWQFEYWQRINKTFFISAFCFIYLKATTLVPEDVSLPKEISKIISRIKILAIKQLHIVAVASLIGIFVVTLLGQAISITSDIITWSALILATAYGTLGIALLVKHRIINNFSSYDQSISVYPKNGRNQSLIGVLSVLLCIIVAVLLMRGLTIAFSDMVLPGLILCGALAGLGYRMLPGGGKKLRLCVSGFFGAITILLGLMITFSTPIITCYQQIYSTTEWIPMYMWQEFNFVQFIGLQLCTAKGLVFLFLGISAACLVGTMPSLKRKKNN